MYWMIFIIKRKNLIFINNNAINLLVIMENFFKEYKV